MRYVVGTRGEGVAWRLLTTAAVVGGLAAACGDGVSGNQGGFAGSSQSNDAGGSAAQQAGGATGTGAAGVGATGVGATGSGVAGTYPGEDPVFELPPGAGGSEGQIPEGNGQPELCDGIDNDANGIVDDVDVGGDGVCDCLNIATIGEIGPWSNGGNLFASWLDARSPLGAVPLADQVLTAELLQPFQVVVLLHAATLAVTGNGRSVPAQHEFSAGEVTAFAQWVEGGGGVMTTIGYSGDEAAEVMNVNRLLGGVGMGYSTTHLDLTGFVQQWEPHALTDGVLDIFTDNGVEPLVMGTALGWGAQDRVALAVNQVEQGRVVVWGDEWITYDSEWADVEDQQVERFWLNILKWLSPPTECQVPIPTILR